MTSAPASPSAPLPDDGQFRLLAQGNHSYGILLLDAQGRVCSWNRGAERLTGLTAEEARGRHVSLLYTPKDQRQGLPDRELAAAHAQGTLQLEGWRQRKDGSTFWAEVDLSVLETEDCASPEPKPGEAAAPPAPLLSMILRDTTARREYEEALRQSEERLRLMIDGVTDYALFMLDVNGHVMTWNSGAANIKGYAQHEIVGRHFSTFYPTDVRATGWPEHELQMAAQHGRFVDEGWRVRKDGSTFWARVTITALRDAEGRLVGFAKLTRDLSERKRVEALEQAQAERENLLDAERNARLAAQQATRVKDEFLAVLSHELRTPLSSILGWTQLLQRKADQCSPEVQRGIEVIDRNARAQVQLIDDLLDLSRIISGKIRLDPLPLAMADVLHKAIETVELAAQAKDITLDVELDAGCLVIGDGTRLQQVAWNLLTNAIKFTPREGRISIHLRHTLRLGGADVELRVQDSGIGIAPDFLPHVFDRFSQRDSSMTRRFGGLGLGLAISRQLVEMHGGTIEAASAGEGSGATFIVRLPAAPAPGGTAAPPAAEPRTEPSGERFDLPSLGGIHVMVVDDESDVRDLLARLLRDRGAKVTTLDSADEALAALTHTRPDILVSDIGMPGTDGYQLIRSIRAAEPLGEKMPALALTAFARAQDRMRALVAGYQAHLGKPFDANEMVLTVANLVDR